MKNQTPSHAQQINEMGNENYFYETLFNLKKNL